MSKPADITKRRVGFWRWVWRIVATTFATCVVLLALAIGLFRLALPMLPDYQQRIEAAATRAIGYPLKVSSIDARWRLQGPELVFNQVEVLSNTSDEKLLEADRLDVVLDIVALIKSRELQPAAVTLSGVQLHLKRDTEGQFFVQNRLLVSRGKNAASMPPDARNLAWGVPNGRFGLRNVSLRYADLKTARPVMEIPDLDLDVVIKGEQMLLEGDMLLPRNMGRRAEFTLEADGAIKDVDGLVWRAFIKGSRVDLGILSEWRPDNLPYASAGVGSFSLWMGGRGKRLEEANAQLDLRDLSLSDAGAGDAPVEIEQFTGRLMWERDADHWRVQGSNIVMRIFDQAWPQTSLNVGMRRQNGLVQYSLSADYLNLDDLDVLVSLVADAAWAQRWRERAPRGEIRDLDGFAVLLNSELTDFGVTADASGLGMAAVDGLPGFSGMDVHVFGGRKRGGADLRSQAAAFSMPGVLRDEVAIDALNLKVRWQKDDKPGHHVRIENIRVVTEDLAARGTISLERDQQSDALLAEMELTVEQLQLAGAKKYFPVNRLSPRLVNWLDNALLDGTGSNGSFYLLGPLNKFPFVNPADGEFAAQIDLQNATLRYADNWPDVRAMDATLYFERNSLRSTIARANLMTLVMQNGEVEIPVFKQPLITLDGQIVSDLGQIRSYLERTPLVKKFGQEWPNFGMNGNANADIHVDFSTVNPEDTRYQIKLEMADSTITYRDWPQTLSGLGGMVNFSDTGISSNALAGIFLGEPVEIDVRPAQDIATPNVTDLFFKGRAQARSLGAHLQENFADVLNGGAEWVAQTRLAPPTASDAPFTVRLQSPLTSMQVNLPRPLAKSAGDPRFLDATISVPEEGVIETILEYGGDTNIHALFSNRQQRWKVQRGEIRFGGGAAILPQEDTVRAVGKIAELDISEILEFTASYGSADPWVTLQHADLGVTTLLGFGQNFLATDIIAAHDGSAWTVSLLSERATGSLRVPDESSPQTPITGDFEVLKWSSTGDNEPLDPQDAPSLRLTADDFAYNEYQLGSMSLSLEARDTIVALREFKTRSEGFETRATGSWSFGSEQPSTFVVAELSSTDVLATLRSLQFAEFIDSGGATAKLELTWPDGWTPDFLQTVVGSLQLKVDKGTLQTVDPGAGRVFGLLSIGALPRRLGLDFRDVFGSGFGFDSIAGDFTIRDGSAFTENLVLEGPAANVGIVGRAGLVAKDYDQTAIVYANFGSSLPLAGTLAGGPAVGAALLVFSELFKRPLRQMGQVSYEITGSWDEPVITKTGSARPAEPVPEAGNEISPLPPESGK